MKTSGGAPSQGHQRAENDGDPVSPPACKVSWRKVKAAPQVHCSEVLIDHVSAKEKEAYVLVSSDDSEGESPQEHLRDRGEMPSIAVTSASPEVASRILKEADVTPELAGSPAETSTETEVQPRGLDSICESCQSLLPETPPMPPSETHKASSSAAHTPDCSSTVEEVGAVSVGTAELRTGTKALDPSIGVSKGTEVPGNDHNGSSEKDLELPTDTVQGAVEERATERKELDKSASEEAVQRIAEPHPNLVLVKTPERPSLITALPANEQLTEAQTGPQNHRPLSLSEMEGGIPEERSAVRSWKETEDLCSPTSVEVSTETELPPNDHKVPSEMGLELTTENTQVVAETSTTLPRQLDDEASPRKAVGVESHLDSALVETSGGTSGLGTAPGTKPLAEEQSLPGNDLPLAATKMQDKVSGGCCGAEGVAEVAKALSSPLEMRPMEAQDKTLARVEAGDEIACPVASSSPLEEEKEHTLTAQSLSTFEERQDRDVQLLGEAENLSGAQVDEASSTLEVVPTEAQSVAQAQPPAEMTLAQSSPKALLGAAETMKEREEASLNQPHAEETTEQARSPEMQRSPEAAVVPETPLRVSDEDEDAEYFEANDCKEAEVPAWDRALEAQEKDNGQDEPLQEVPVWSPVSIPEEAEEGTLVHTDAEPTEESRLEDSSQQC